MKMIHKLSIAALAISALACAQIEDPNVPQLNENTIVFTATVPTRTAIAEDDKTVTWVAGDEVKFVWEGGETVATAAGDGASTTFTVQVDENVNEIYAVYPVDACAGLVDGEVTLNFSNQLTGGEFSKADICVAKAVKNGDSWNKGLNFKNVACLLKVGVTTDDITRVQVQAVGLEVIAGTLPVSIDDDGQLVLGGAEGDKNTVNMAVSGAGNYYITVLPNVEMASGFRVNCFKGEEQMTPFYYPGSFTTACGQIIKLSEIESRLGQYYVTPEGAGTKTGQSWSNAMDTQTFVDFVENADNFFVLRNAVVNFSAEEFDFGNYLMPSFDGHGEVPFTLQGTKNGEAMTTFVGRSGDNAGMLWPKTSANVTVKNVRFTGADGNSNRSAIRINTSSAKLTLDGCEFIDNKTSGNGACINVYKDVPLVIKNCLFQDNYGWGAALYIDKSCSDINVTFEDTQIIENTGNPVWGCNANTVTFERVLFKDNITTPEDGGSAVAIEGSGIYTFTDTEFIGNVCDLTSNTQKGGVVMILTDNAEARFNRCLFDGNVTNRTVSKNEASAAVVNSRNASTFYFNACEFKENSSGTGNSTGFYGGLKGTVIATYKAATIAMNNCYVHDNYGGRNSDDIAWIYIDNASAKFIMSNTTVIGDQTRYGYDSPKNKKGVIRLQQDCYSHVYNSIICSKYEDGKSIGCGVAIEINSLYNKTSPGLDEDTVWKTDTGSGHDYYASTDCFGGLKGYMWNGQMTGTNSEVLAPTSDINSAIQNADEGFYNWLAEIGALGTDIDGKTRGTLSSPGCYQAN